MAESEKHSVIVSEDALALNLQQRERVDPQTGYTAVVPALVRTCIYKSTYRLVHALT